MMDWTEIGKWTLGALAVLAAGGWTVKLVLGGRRKNVSTTVKTSQKGNVVGRDMAGRDNISNN